MSESNQKIGEANFKVAVFQEYFGTKIFTYMQEVDRIDFVIIDKATERHLIWAESKRNAFKIVDMFVQLILTIGKARTFDTYNPPPFLCVFDYQKIAFLQYNAVHDIFYLNDFNWNVTPSDHSTKEFKMIQGIVEKTIQEKKLLFHFETDKTLIKSFINDNFNRHLELFPELITRLQIDKNNFIPTYNRWVLAVKPSIAIDWNIAKTRNIIDGDFYLADLLSKENVTLKDKLYVLLKKTNYEIDRHLDDMGLFTSKTVQFNDDGKAHKEFWEKYERPPKKEYWTHIIQRRDLLVPQDIRERKGSFFTPQIWVNKSQEYITDVFGEDWQDTYYVWDCCAGTGNLLAGLTDKYKIWASTLDKQDVDVMKDRIKNGANLLESHVFQFDFLNDSFDDLPKELKKIIDSPEERKKLIIYINPPYAEASSSTNFTGTGKNKPNVAMSHKTSEIYKQLLGRGINELFAQFFVHIYNSIPDAKIALFSTLKYINSQNFVKFREHIKATYKAGFICRANTFDNVTGKFPIGFLIWDTEKKKTMKEVKIDIFESDNKATNCWYSGKKKFRPNDKGRFIVDWLRQFFDKDEKNRIGFLRFQGTDFQTSSNAFFTSFPTENDIRESKITNISKNNIVEISIYLSVRHCIEPTWLNNRDQFLFPNDNYKTDEIFQNDCTIYSLFHGQNGITSANNINHWIPFTAQEVNAKENFQSDFMSKYLKGKELSKEANETMNAGRELWKYYQAKTANHPTAPNDASFYDIREFFQGRKEDGKMNTKSGDETYNALIKELRAKLAALGEAIKPKVYEYGFLVE